MFEVFNAVTGETHGFTESAAEAAVVTTYLTRRDGQMYDYIDADNESCDWAPSYWGPLGMSGVQE